MPRAYGITNAAPYASAPAVGSAGDTYWNTATSTLYTGHSAVNTANGLKMTSMGSKEFQLGPNAILYAIAESTPCDVRVLEQS